MDYTSLPFDVPSGYFHDLMNDNTLNLEAGFPSEEEFLNDGVMRGLDLDVLQMLNSQDNRTGKLPSNEGNMFPTLGMTMGVASADSGKFHHQPPPLTDLPTFSTEHGLNDLLHSASPLATERALFMGTTATTSIDGSNSNNNSAGSPTAPGQLQTTLHHSPLPLLAFDDLDPGSSPDTSHFSYPGYDDIYYGVPGEPFPMSDMAIPSTSNLQPSLPHPILPSHGNANNNNNNNNDNLLEMPDGSTRLTANWLPVDPQVGFTIDVPQFACKSGA